MHDGKIIDYIYIIIYYLELLKSLGVDWERWRRRIGPSETNNLTDFRNLILNLLTRTTQLIIRRYNRGKARKCEATFLRMHRMGCLTSKST